MIETTFAGGINPFTVAFSAPAVLPGNEPITKRHTLYKWVEANPLRTRIEIAEATGRTRNAVKRITNVMVAYGLMTYEVRLQKGRKTYFVKVKV